MLIQKWIEAIISSNPKYTYLGSHIVCSNHFQDPSDPEAVPTLFMENNMMSSKQRDQEELPSIEHLIIEPVTFQQVVQDGKVTYYTGFKNADMFRTIFEFLAPKTVGMTYWDGAKRTKLHDTDAVKRPGRPKQFSHDEEFFLVCIWLRRGLGKEDLAFRFRMSIGSVSRAISTWIRLISKEIGPRLIKFPSRHDMTSWLPQSFKNRCPDIRCIIDCSEVFVDTPSSLEAQSELWSDYKHHCTVKFLVAISPNGAITWLSPTYGGRASDKYIVKDSRFLQYLEPGDVIMADKDFKIQTELAAKSARLYIPPFARGSQMTEADVKKTQDIANLRIFVEQAIGRMKSCLLYTSPSPRD